MKKGNFYFIGECAIILALLAFIGVLLKDENHTVQGKEIVTAVVETEEEAVNEEKEVLVREGEEIETEVPDVQIMISETAVETVSEEMPETMNSVSENSVSESSVSENMLLSESEDKVKIVVFGDSIWDSERGEDGISERIMEQIDVEIYNCAIGGTTAAVVNESTQWYDWQSRSFNGMMYIANDIVSADKLISGYPAQEVISNVNFEEVDYVIVSYGLNDYFSDVPIYPQEYFDLKSYVGALRHGAHKLKEKYPNLEIILTSPTYCKWFSGERQFELGSYVEAARGVAQEMNLHFLDMYHALGKNPDEKTEYLSDGVHLNAEGRELYANCVAKYLKEQTAEE